MRQLLIPVTTRASWGPRKGLEDQYSEAAGWDVGEGLEHEGSGVESREKEALAELSVGRHEAAADVTIHDSWTSASGISEECVKMLISRSGVSVEHSAAVEKATYSGYLSSPNE
jgi:hypothetical protein